MKVKIFILITFAMQLAFAQTTVGLKDVYSSKFKFGNILNSSTVNNNTMKQLILREFNSITPENELKPDATIVASGSTDDNVKVQLNNGAKAILQFCQDNNIPVRGHTLVWHSQTPEWFFRTGFTSSGAVVSKAVMKKRMESYIKNMFALIKSSYPNLNLYAYDVVNEAAKESGSGPRDPGSGDGKSMWVQVYGDNSFIEEAFTFARQYAPATTKLFYNDCNEYITAKRDYIANSIIKPLKEKGVLDGMGMQSHLDVRTGTPYPTPADYGAAITVYKNLGVEIHVSELDATITDGNESYFPAQATYYKDIMNQILTKGGSAVTAVVIWGIQDDQSWRKARKPLVFDASGNKKAAYDELVKLIPQSDWGNPGGSSSSISVTCNVNNLQASYAAGSNIPRPNIVCGNSTTAGAASFYANGSTDVIAGWSSSGGTNQFYNTGTRTITLGDVMCGTTKVTLSPAISCGSFNVVAASSSSGTNNGSSSSAAASLSSSSSLANSSSSLASSSSITSSSSNSGAESSSSSEDGETPILNYSQFSILNSQLVSYYTIKGEPLGNAKPQKAGVYIVKQGHSVKKIAVR